MFLLTTHLCLASEMLIEPAKYIAVTESEFSLEINLLENQIAEVTFGYLAEDIDQKDAFTLEKGNWLVKNGILSINLKSGNLKYKLVKNLEHSNFGYKGSSFGLEPFKENGYPMNKYSLWRKNKIDALFK